MRLIETSLPGVMGKVSQNSRLDLAVSGSAARTSVRTHRLALPFAGVLALALPAACTKSPPADSTSGAGGAAGGSPSAAPPGSSGAPAGSAVAVHDASAPVDAGPGPMLGGLFPQTPIMSDMDWPFHEDPRHPDRKPKEHPAVRIGYIRQGGRVAVVPEAHPKQNCPEGWYELVDGGFVCGRYATLDMNHPKLRLAAHPPFLDQPLPYQYGYNITNGTPLYKSIPSKEERVKLEPWLKPRPKPKPAREREASNDLDGGLTPVAVTLGPGNTTAGDPLGLGGEDAGVPWYLREFDGGKPQNHARRAARGGGGPNREADGQGVLPGARQGGRQRDAEGDQVVAVDERPARPLRAHLPRASAHRLPRRVARPGPLAGGPRRADRAPVDAGFTPTPRPSKKLDFPVAFVLWGHAHKYNLSEDRKKATAFEGVRRFTAVQLTGQDATVGGYHYIETVDGWWMREAEGTVARTTTPPKDLAPNEKWIDVNLKTQTLVAFVGERPVFATLVSTGRMNDDDKEKDHGPSPASSASARSTSRRRWTATSRPTARTRSRTSPGSCTSTRQSRSTAPSGTRTSGTCRATAA